MNYEIIQFRNHRIFKIKIEGLDKKTIIEDFGKEHVFLSKTHCADNIMRKSIRDLYSLCYEKIEYVYQSELDRNIVSGYQSGWILNCKPSDYTGDYHIHTSFSPNYPNILSDFTWTYYLQVPDNLHDKEGHLLLKDEDEEFAILPEEGCLYTFESNLLHRGEIAPNSTKNRIVIVGNITFFYE